jgi:hypothetical protein
MQMDLKALAGAEFQNTRNAIMQDSGLKRFLQRQRRPFARTGFASFHCAADGTSDARQFFNV